MGSAGGLLLVLAHRPAGVSSPTPWGEELGLGGSWLRGPGVVCALWVEGPPGGTVRLWLCGLVCRVYVCARLDECGCAQGAYVTVCMDICRHSGHAWVCGGIYVCVGMLRHVLVCIDTFWYVYAYIYVLCLLVCVLACPCVYMYVQALLRESLWVRVFEVCQGQGSAHGSLGPSCLLPFSWAQRAAGSSHHWPVGPLLRAPSLENVRVPFPSGPQCTQTLLLTPLLAGSP